MKTCKQIAKYIADHPALGLRAKVEPWRSSTDRKIGRLSWPGKGRKGSRIRIWCGDALVLDHKNSETYRRVSEVTDWLTRWERGERVDYYGQPAENWKRGLAAL